MDRARAADRACQQAGMGVDTVRAANLILAEELEPTPMVRAARIPRLARGLLNSGPGPGQQGPRTPSQERPAGKIENS